MGNWMRVSHALALALPVATLELKLDAFILRWSSGIGQINRVRRGARRSAAYARVAQVVSGFRRHGIHQLISRGVSPAAMLDALRSPLTIRPRPNGTIQYIVARVTVVLNGAGEVVTAWSR